MPWMESEDRTEAGEDGAALAERVRLGDHAAEKDLYVRFSGRVFAMGVARLKDREAARELAVDGTALMALAGRPGGPWLGRLQAHLLERVLEDPGLNTPAALRSAAEAWLRGLPDA